MTTTYIRGPETARFASAAVFPTPAEAAVAGALKSLADSRLAIWTDWVGGAAKPYSNMGATQDPAASRLLDRLGRREFLPNAWGGTLTNRRHPVLVTDSITARPVAVFGAGGAAPNLLDTSFNGVLRTVTDLDAAGQAGNQTPFFTIGAGWSAAFKVRRHAPSATVNGIAMPSTSEGAVWGGCATGAGVSGTVGPLIGFSGSRFTVRNQSNVSTAGQQIDIIGDTRDGLWHDYVATWNPATTTLRAWADGVESTAVTTCTTDVTSAATQPMLGGTGPTNQPEQRFAGFLAFALLVQGPVLNDATLRGQVRTLMAER